jgi:DNA-directed RNA polymerase specialized sigma24 family protein
MKVNRSIPFPNRGGYAGRPANVERDPVLDDVWSRVHGGDRDAVSELLQRIEKCGVELIDRHVRSAFARNNAQEVVQATLLTILDKATCATPLELPAWHAVATVIDMLKKSSRKLRTFFHITPERRAAPKDLTSIPDHILERCGLFHRDGGDVDSSAVSDVVSDEIRKLDSRLQEILALYSKGVSEMAIAEQFGVSYDALRQTLSRTFGRIRAAVQKRIAA